MRNISRVLLLGIVFLIVQSASCLANERLFKGFLAEKSLANWVNNKEFGGMTGVPDSLVTREELSDHLMSAQRIARSGDQEAFTQVFQNISAGIRDGDYGPLVGWYLAAKGTPLASKYMVWLPSLYEPKNPVLNKAIAFIDQNATHSKSSSVSGGHAPAWRSGHRCDCREWS